jgi:alkylation response protein AidB-like acyl-CoA dehydrogenase
MVISRGEPMEDKIKRAWARARELRPVIEAHRSEGDLLRRLPDAIAQAFVAANVYRLLLPEDFGGEGIDPITYYDLVEEVSSYDGSVGWNYSIGTTTAVMLGDLSIKRLRTIFADADCCLAGAAAPPGRAIAMDGGIGLADAGRGPAVSIRRSGSWVIAWFSTATGYKRRPTALRLCSAS